ncbi:MAG TPA: glycosyltransferase family 4 protein, partial [Longimicrobiaceae bacterium]|nr:glycosyltransferase family 4 protein [Longimicrobiaceae bacterium]
MARVLLHSLVFAPEANSTSYLMTDLARQLQRQGHAVTVLTTTPHNNLEAGALARQPLRRVWPGLLYRSALEGIPVWHVKLPMKENRVLRRMLDYIRFHAVSLVAGPALVGRYDIVLAPSPPLTIGVAGWVLSVWGRTPVVYNVQEIYPDFAINQGLIRNPAFIRLLQWVERFVYARSDRIVSISEGFQRTIRARGVAEEKLLVIPNFVDTELYRPLPRHNEFSAQHELDDDFVVLYGGNIGLSQDW